jgi:hypothetical protein
LSTSIVRRAASASAAFEEKSVSCTAFLPTATTAIRSRAGFEPTNCRAATDASTIAWPIIDCERSKSSITLFSRPRLTAWNPTTAPPFSVTGGADASGFGVTTVTRTVG